MMTNDLLPLDPVTWFRCKPGGINRGMEKIQATVQWVRGEKVAIKILGKNGEIHVRYVNRESVEKQKEG